MACTMTKQPTAEVEEPTTAGRTAEPTADAEEPGAAR